MDNVIYLPLPPGDGVPVDRVLAHAPEHIGKLMHVVMLGINNDGDAEVYSSLGSLTDVLWVIERFKADLMNNKWCDVSAWPIADQQAEGAQDDAPETAE